MKIKLWQFEYDFDRDDAKVVVPIALLLIAIAATTLDPVWLLASVATYYLLYFFLKDAIDNWHSFAPPAFSPNG